MNQNQSQYRPQVTNLPPPPPYRPRRRKPKVPLLFGVCGLVIGLILGGGAMLAAFSLTDFVGGSATQARAAAGKTQPVVFGNAVKGCNLSSADGVDLGDDGHTLIIDSKGEEDYSGVDIDDVACLLSAVDMPDSVVAEIDSTRALDGTQKARWQEFHASWTYHPDDGVRLILTIDKQ